MGMEMVKGNNNRKKRAYGMMLIMAFGAALIGVMVIHRLRERRIFNLILKEKDHQLFSLQILLQKEKGSTDEMKRKIADIKSKIITLRTQKMELHDRVVEMQSTIGSIKDELRAMESAMEERNNEIKMLRDRELVSQKEILHLAGLRESLKQKEAEIEDLKQHRNVPVRVWSVSTDDPSNPAVNLTVNANMGANSTTDDGSEIKSIDFGMYVKASVRNDSIGNSLLDTEQRDMASEQMQKPENFTNESSNPEGIANEKNADEDSQDGGRIGEEKLMANGTGFIQDGATEKVETLQEGEGRKTQVISRGGVKMEMTDDGSRIGSGIRGKARHGNLSRTKVKKWKTVGENRRMESNGGTNLRGIKFITKAHREIFKDEIHRYIAKNEKPDGEIAKNVSVKQFEDPETNVIREIVINRDIEKLKKNEAEERKVSEEHDMPEDNQESESEDATNGDFFRGSESSFEEEEELKEETDESEF